MLRRCSRCGVEKDTSDFSPHPKGLHGTSSWCKPCKAEHARNTPADPARRAASRARNAAKRAAYNRAYRAAHPEREREAKRIREARRRARLAEAVTIQFTADELAQRLAMQSGCWICGFTADQIDHVKPIAAGGAHILANLRPICGPCNQRKRSKWPVDTRALERA